MQWHESIISAFWRAEAGGWLEPRRSRLQWAEMVPLHSSLGDPVSKKKVKRKSKDKQPNRKNRQKNPAGASLK